MREWKVAYECYELINAESVQEAAAIFKEIYSHRRIVKITKERNLRDDEYVEEY